MSTGVQLHLALILFAPWFAVLSALFWRYPRQPRGLARRIFDTAALTTATAAAVAGMYWGMANADAGYGPMWKQVFATSLAYGLYLGVMAAALVARMRWLRGPNPPPSRASSRS
ncbi:hypothetical protein [Lysobacter arvi]|uniref:Transmembrane protein n=1 Tax=Lysobacter arvi TaxID=3038776 RepID=A0ABU1CFJ9_9GAMM|nr:hypothetical protein [Lysobacter arvi]MDR0183724.1 hypothetical protein [Lysobacter arvi]